MRKQNDLSPVRTKPLGSPLVVGPTYTGMMRGGTGGMGMEFTTRGSEFMRERTPGMKTTDKLQAGSSQKTISKNIATEMKSGSLTAKGAAGKQKQAAAIAYSKARQGGYDKADAAKPFNASSQMSWARKMQIKAQGGMAATGKGQKLAKPH